MCASIKPLHVSVFFSTIFRGSSAVLCAVTIPPADLRSFGFVLLRSMWPHVYVICVCLVFLSVGYLLVYVICVCLVFLSVGDLLVYVICLCLVFLSVGDLLVYVICVCLVFLSVGDLLVNTSRSPTDKNTKHTQMTYT
jgi:hypothetical protein